MKVKNYIQLWMQISNISIICVFSYHPSRILGKLSRLVWLIDGLIEIFFEPLETNLYDETSEGKG